VDRRRKLVANLALSGPTSRNGYRYSESALQSAVALYEHKPVFLDHASDRARPELRSTRDLVGTIVQPRFEGGRIRGDVRVLDTDAGRTFAALCDADAPGIGMSHVVLAERSTDRSVVERIVEVLSVDVVIRPATTTTFREAQALHETSDDAAERGPACVAARPELAERSSSPIAAAERANLRGRARQLAVLVERFVAELEHAERESPSGWGSVEFEGSRDGVEDSRALPETATAGAAGHTSVLTVSGAAAGSAGAGEHRETLNEVGREPAVEQISQHGPARELSSGAELERWRSWLQAARLPAFAVSQLFCEQLSAAGSDAQRRALIDERCALLRQAGEHRPRSEVRQLGAEAGDRDAFVRALRGEHPRRPGAAGRIGAAGD
jgi:hypothetical protein